MSSSRSSPGGGFAGLFGLLLLIGIIIKFIWWILGAVALVAMFFITRAFLRWYDERRAAEARYRDGLAVRADRQHNWVLRGDDRGIYGTEGAKLMHYLYPKGRYG
jgi:fatty acid desaturase